jgi:adenine deaminase
MDQDRSLFGETPRRELLKPILEEDEADTAIIGGKHVNVTSGEILREDIAITGDRIAFVGDIEGVVGESTTIIDAEGQYVVPGLIEGHLHSYHSYINGTELAKLLLQHGVTSYADGFYGQAIVGGMDAIHACKSEIEATPLGLIFLAPCVAHHQQDEIDHPPSNATISTENMMEMIEWPDCHGLEEPTPGQILHQREAYLDLFEKTIANDKVITGHAAELDSTELNAYVSLGASTDHEMVSQWEGVEWLRRGMHLLVRDGSSAHNVPEVSKALTEEGLDHRNVGFSSDMLELDELAAHGSIDANVRIAIENGVAPIEAIQAGTLGTAEALRVDQELGSITPGKVADILLVDDLPEFEIDRVISNGETVVEDGKLVAEFDRPSHPESVTDTIELPSDITAEDFRATAPAGAGSVTARTIEIGPGHILTEEGEATLAVSDDGIVHPDPSRDVLVAVMVNRFDGSGRVGKAFVDGYGIDAGAVGLTVNSQRQNVSIIGTNHGDMGVVLNRLEELHGGMVVVEDGEVLAEMPLGVFGLQSSKTAEAAIGDFEAVKRSIHELGCELPNPISSLEFINLTAGIPSLRLSDHGLTDAITGAQFDLIKQTTAKN